MAKLVDLLNALNAAGRLVHLDYYPNGTRAQYESDVKTAIARAGKGKQPGIPQATYAMLSDLIVYALALLDDKYKNDAIIHAIAFEMSDTSLRQPKCMYVIGKASQAGGVSIGDALYILASMSRVLSSKKCHSLYYHPPEFVGHKVITSPELRRQALTSAAGVPAAPAAPAPPIMAPPGPGGIPAMYDV